MSINPTSSQMPNTLTNVYLLQTDPSINSSCDQVLPLHLLESNVDYSRNQYLLPISSNSKQTELDQLVFIDSCQDSGKILGFLVEKDYQNLQTQLAVSNIPYQTHSISDYCTEEDLPPERLRPDIVKVQSNIKTESNNKNDEGAEISAHAIQNYVKIPDRVVPPRALAVLPNVLQAMPRNNIIATRRRLPSRARFGPVQGIKYRISQSEAVELVLEATSNKKPLFLIKTDENHITHIETSDKDKSNWISLLPLGDEKTANVWLYEEKRELYGITTESIQQRRPLMLGYSKKYADDYGLIGPTKDITKAPESSVRSPWWCYECQKVLPSASMLQRHMDLYHGEDKKYSRRKYRCIHCSQTFARLFTLRRHKSCHCLNRPVKKNNIASCTETDPQINTNTSVCSEDNRMPSDESFQNYTNGLDFSTNLFDTDRISNLDISVNSRSENDFNPYNTADRDESVFSSDLLRSNKVENTQKSTEKKAQKTVEMSMDQLTVTCPHCFQVIVKQKRRLHVRECPARRFECECKKVFTSKKQLEEHIQTQHSTKDTKTDQKDKDKDNSTQDATNSPNAIIYKCDTCPLYFKRRGMLVNHLWRVHKTTSTLVPLERRVRHYPCVICPKIYATAAKRDRHVLVHHPGVGKFDRKALEGGTRVCEPAVCSECPRQYVTRAKLLQHQRIHHPYLTYFELENPAFCCIGLSVPPPIARKPVNR